MRRAPVTLNTSRLVLPKIEQPMLDDPRLERMAREESNAWVARLLGKLTAEGRAVEGGWPGTVSEARRLVATRIATETVAKSSFVAVTATQHEQLVRAVYSGAKKQWLAQAFSSRSA